MKSKQKELTQKQEDLASGSGMKKCWMQAAHLQETSPDIMITRKPLRVLIPLQEKHVSFTS